MGTNSRNEILNQMAGKSVMSGWGAITVFNRTRINRFLEQQYITRMQGYSFIPAFKGAVTLEGNASATVQLESIMLGKPLLSFADEASLDESYATVTMNMVSGTVLMMQPGERVARVATSLRIRESQGYQLKLRIKLSVVAGSINDQGLVIMDLKEGVDFTCDVLPDYLDQAAIGLAFKEYFESLPVYQRVFVLGMLDVSQYDPLAPKEFAILTQRAPGAEKIAASNYGDGGVVVFIRVAGDKEKGVLPSEGSGFPYLIPDDEEEGVSIYSAAIVVAEKWKRYVGDEQISKLSSLLYPGAEVFESKDTATPHDYVNFGNVNPASTQLAIEPSMVTLQAGKSETFKLLDAQGVPVTGVVWTAKSLNSRTLNAAGSISSSGVYTAADQEYIGHDTVRVVITGTVYQEDRVFTVSAGVSVFVDNMVVAPQLSSRIIEQNPKPIKLSVTSTSRSQLTWTLSQPDVGTLEFPTPNTAIYTPPTFEQAEFETVQIITAYDASTDQSASSTVLLFNDFLTSKVSPSYVRHMKRSASQLFEIADDTGEGTKHWSVISGEGEFKDPSVGEFTAPDTVTASVSIVKCDWIYQGLTRSFYSTVELDRFEDEPDWKDLNTFSIRVLDSRGSLTDAGYAYRNGLQQIKLAVVIETKKVGQDSIRPSAEELQTLRLLFSNGSVVDPLLPEQSGIIPGTSVSWATHTIANSVHLYPVSSASVSASLPVPLDEESTVRLEMYVHTTAPAKENSTFHLSFIGGALDETWYSTELNESLGKVTLTPIEIPKIQENEFTFVRTEIDDGTRLVSADSSAPSQQHLARTVALEPEPEPGSEYDFKLRTIAYYEFNFLNRKIASFKFTTDQDSGGFARKSTVRWESRLQEETMFSYTGYAWNPALLEGIPEGEPKKNHLQFDPDLNLLVTKEGALTIPVARPAAVGGIIFSMHRTDDVRYGDAKEGEALIVRDALYDSIFANVMDEYGCWYLMEVSFPEEKVHDRENLAVRFL